MDQSNDSLENIIHLKDTNLHEFIRLVITGADDNNESCISYINKTPIRNFLNKTVFEPDEIKYYAERSYSAPYSTCFLAFLYLKGKYGIDKDYAKAVPVINYYAETGLIFAISILGYMNRDGIGVDQDYDKALKLFKLASDSGNTESMGDLGYMYDLGLGTQIDYKKAIEYYEAASKNDCMISTYNLALLYFYGTGVQKDYVKAFTLLELANNSGYRRAMDLLGYMYWNGFGTVLNRVKAVEVYETASNLGDKFAKVSLAYIYYKGFEMPVDYKKAFELFESASNLGNMEGTHYMGKMYFEGRGVTQNYKKAIELFEIASSFGETMSINKLAELYEHGLDPELKQDYIKAIELYLKSGNYEKIREIIDGIFGLDNCVNNSDTGKTISPKILDYFLQLDLSMIYGDNIPQTLILIQNVYKQKIDMIHLHFYYSCEGKGFNEAKEDFYNLTAEMDGK